MKYKKVQGDTFILCTFGLSLVRSPGCDVNVLDSNNNLSELCKSIPEHLEMEGDRLSVCRVGRWVAPESDISDTRPLDLETIFEVEPYEIEAMEDEEEETEVTNES